MGPKKKAYDDRVENDGTFITVSVRFKWWNGERMCKHFYKAACRNDKKKKVMGLYEPYSPFCF